MKKKKTSDKVLSYMQEHKDEEGKITVSYKDLSKEIGKRKSTVCMAILLLQDKQLITCISNNNGKIKTYQVL